MPSTRRLRDGLGSSRHGSLEIYISDAPGAVAMIGKKRALELRTWSTIVDVKSVLNERLHLPIGSQR